MTPSAATLAATCAYSGARASARWEGHHVADAARFRDFMKRVVAARVADNETTFDAELQGLTTTGMGAAHLKRVLKAVPKPTSWDVGEALAECALALDSGREIIWPWNTVRDRRTPRASLPGADLIGFCREGASVTLMLGEVKTSADASVPPNVMHGVGGLAWQLEENATRWDVHHSVLKWLKHRCLTDAHVALYRAAVTRYLESEGREIIVAGVLLRDTSPAEGDLRGRGVALSKRLPTPTQVALFAWYLPVAIDEWPALVTGASP